MDNNESRPLVYLDTCIISELIKDPSQRPHHEDDMNAMCDIAMYHDPSGFVTSQKALEEFRRDRDTRRRSLKEEVYQWLEKVSESSKGIMLIPVFNTDKRTPMLPIHDPYNPPRPPGTEPPKLPKGVTPPPQYLVGHDILFHDRELLRKLKGIFDPADAEHIYQAIVGKCQYFVTVDRKTILTRVTDNKELIKTICPNLDFMSPIQLLENSRHNLNKNQ